VYFTLNAWQRRVSNISHVMTTSNEPGKQNLTIRLDPQIVRKAEVLAARCSISISDLLARQIEILVGEEVAYERAQHDAMTLLDHGFHLGGGIRTRREGSHERLAAFPGVSEGRQNVAHRGSGGKMCQEIENSPGKGDTGAKAHFSRGA
jgi:hypothetical protein